MLGLVSDMPWSLGSLVSGAALTAFGLVLCCVACLAGAFPAF